MPKEISIETKYSAKILGALEELFNPDSHHALDLEELQADDNATAFFHALANIVPTQVYNNFTNDKKNTLEFNHLANRLCFQNMNKGK